ncbi:hypothetical protein BU24DRAFT_463485 [Aaosphaeria arxii CBS 175.79]|uniref:Uncharacterized protein n=1 Tax=Aaosphaeria arxii CBS 175.79 TaxID=1450172 RepID=A0A6A5XP57_9PLEO|nr:uncharacterized protein BU24DRAFT_463485 [Aaosphaeria arxii CBS 175.79]KAF2014723.1 hypothetical protein BU24DRAFT_463485 [Aaosphaeria arxii CBS 175.79]
MPRNNRCSSSTNTSQNTNYGTITISYAPSATSSTSTAMTEDMPPSPPTPHNPNEQIPLSPAEPHTRSKRPTRNFAASNMYYDFSGGRSQAYLALEIEGDEDGRGMYEHSDDAGGEDDRDDELKGVEKGLILVLVLVSCGFVGLLVACGRQVGM